VREYPDGGAERLAAAIAGHVGVPARCVVVGSGSDQILDLAVAHLLARRSRVLVTDPTFSFFEARLALHGMRAVRVPFGPDMAVDMGALEGAARGADAIYLDSPNNPTGFQFPERRLRRLIRSFGGLVIIDEAYAAFAGYSLAAMARAQENLAVVGTLSKSFGLAGLRVGYAVMPPAMARAFASVIQYPYPVSSVSIEAARARRGPQGVPARDGGHARAKLAPPHGDKGHHGLGLPSIVAWPPALASLAASPPALSPSCGMPAAACACLSMSS